MLEGMYAAAAGMEAQQAQLDAISNDIANTDTPGYQAEQVGFRDLLYSTDDDDPSTAIVGAGAALTTLGYDQTQGAIEQTHNPLDVALSGPGYLEVRQADGTIGLTRNGTLQLNSAGQLTTTTGLRMVPPITVPAGTRPADVQIAANGTVSANGRTLGRLSIVSVTAPDQLVPQGGGVFSPSAATGPLTRSTATTLTQGALTQSNVDMSTEMTQMMTTEQAYDMASKAIQFESQMGQIAATIK
jgi:flagellar basal-body rod protein FlgG